MAVPCSRQLLIGLLALGLSAWTPYFVRRSGKGDLVPHDQVVGEVHDEHDPHETPDLAPAGTDDDGRALYSADGSARVDELARVGMRVPEGPYETLAGLVATELGRIPALGDTVDVAGWRLDVVDASGHRAARVLLHAPNLSGGER